MKILKYTQSLKIYYLQKGRIYAAARMMSSDAPQMFGTTATLTSRNRWWTSAEEMEAVQLQPWEKNYCADLHVKVEAMSTYPCLCRDTST